MRTSKETESKERYEAAETLKVPFCIQFQFFGRALAFDEKEAKNDRSVNVSFLCYRTHTSLESQILNTLILYYCLEYFIDIKFGLNLFICDRIKIN